MYYYPIEFFFQKKTKNYNKILHYNIEGGEADPDPVVNAVFQTVLMIQWNQPMQERF